MARHPVVSPAGSMDKDECLRLVREALAKKEEQLAGYEEKRSKLVESYRKQLVAWLVKEMKGDGKLGDPALFEKALMGNSDYAQVYHLGFPPEPKELQGDMRGEMQKLERLRKRVRQLEAWPAKKVFRLRAAQWERYVNGENYYNTY